MARAQFLSLSRLWYTLFIVLIQLVLIYFGIKLCYINDRVPWPKSMAPPKFELFFQKISLLTALFLLIIFIYPSLFRINNFANDQKTLKVEHHQNESTKKPRSSLCSTVWQHCFALSSSLHLIMSYLIVISTVLIDAKQILVGIKDSSKFILISIVFTVLLDFHLKISFGELILIYCSTGHRHQYRHQFTYPNV